MYKIVKNQFGKIVSIKKETEEQTIFIPINPNNLHYASLKEELENGVDLFDENDNLMDNEEKQEFVSKLPKSKTVTINHPFKR
jgi:hypothetical protein